jgi:hypothetical protein
MKITGTIMYVNDTSILNIGQDINELQKKPQRKKLA